MKWAQCIEDRMMQGGRQTGNFGQRFNEMDSPTRNKNINQINSFLNSNNEIPNANVNVNMGRNMGPSQEANINVGQTNFNSSFDTGHRADTNRSVFETRRDPILIENSFPHNDHRSFNISTNANNFSMNTQGPPPITIQGPPSIEVNTNNQANFGVNANYNNGMMFSNANTLGSNIRQGQHHTVDRNYFGGNQMSKV